MQTNSLSELNALQWLLILICLQCWSATAAAGPDVTYYRAKSYDQATDELVYTEQYHRHGQQALVVFSDATGVKVSSKKLDFTVSEILPKIDFYNYSSGNQWFIHPSNDQIDVGYKKAGQNSWNKDTVIHQQPSVFDVGYIVFLQAKQRALLLKEKVIFYTPIPFVNRSFKMQAHLSSDINCPLDPKQYYCIKITPNSFLLRTIVPAIYMSFSQIEFRLRAYWGPTNTSVGDRKRFYVHTLYEYSS